jgi:hypothetical protein
VPYLLRRRPWVDVDDGTIPADRNHTVDFPAGSSQFEQSLILGLQR